MSAPNLIPHIRSALANLRPAERKVADIAIERRPDASSKPVRAPIGMYGGDNGYSSNGGFFDFLFGGPHSAAVPTYRPPHAGPRVGNNGRYYFR